MSTSFNSSSPNNISLVEYFAQCADNPLGFRFWSGFSVASFLLGFPASLVVVLELFRKRRQKTTNDLFMFNINVMELIFICIMPLSVCNSMIWKRITFEFFINLIYNLAMSVRPLFMVCICVDCYFAVLHPITYKNFKTSNIIRKAACVIVWILCLCYSLYMAFTPGIFGSPLSSMPFIAALPAITFCDISILNALRKPDPSSNKSIHPQKKRALHAIVNSFVLTFIVYLPPLIIYSFGVIMPVTRLDYNCILAIFGLCISMTGCFIMPILHLGSLGKFDFLKERWYKIFLMLKVPFY